jgi:hypothetical protein
MKSINQLLTETKDLKRPTNLYTEFQEFGVYLADQLADPKHCSLYIKIAKTVDRSLIDEALTYTKAYTTAKSPAKIFMWKLKELKNLKAL